MTRQRLMILAAAGSLALLGGAFIFQFVGYPPCKMCLWQRWPHAVAIVIGLLAIFVPHRLLAVLGALAAATTAGIGAFHSGVEQGWWEGPTTCTGGGGLDGLSGSDLLSTDGPRVIMCDVISWQMFGLSMATWNAVFSAVLVGIWIMAALRRAD